MYINKTFKLGVANIIASLLMVGGASISFPAYAQDKPVEGRQFSAKSGEIVNAANEFAAAEQHSAALSKLSEALTLPDLNPYEKSIIYQMQGSSYYAMNQFGPAIASFENAISAGGFLPNEVENLRVQIAQLLIGNEQYAQGAQMLEDYLARGGQEKPKYVEYITQAWLGAENYSRALPWAEKWFRNSNPKERKHFDLLNFLYNTLGMQSKQSDIVKQMINKWPDDKTLWASWASLLDQSGRETEAFEVNRMLYLGGALTDEVDLLRLLQYYSSYEIPYQGAEILEREIKSGRISRSEKNLTQLATFYRQSREYEKAIPILEDAAKLSNDEKRYAELGEALYKEGRCDDAQSAFESAISRGYNSGRAWLQIASCRYDQTQNLERLSCEMNDAQLAAAPITKGREAAISAFKNVSSSSREGRDAKKWISFIESERGTFNRRCAVEIQIKEELCFQKIKNAKDNLIFTENKLIIEDQSCLQYVDKYESLYEIRTTG